MVDTIGFNLTLGEKVALEAFQVEISNLFCMQCKSVVDLRAIFVYHTDAHRACPEYLECSNQNWAIKPTPLIYFNSSASVLNGK